MRAFQVQVHRVSVTVFAVGVGWDNGPASLNAITTAVAAWTADVITISLMPSDSDISLLLLAIYV